MYAEESGHREQVMGRLLLVVACVLAFDFVAGPGRLSHNRPSTRSATRCPQALACAWEPCVFAPLQA